MHADKGFSYIRDREKFCYLIPVKSIAEADRNELIQYGASLHNYSLEKMYLLKRLKWNKILIQKHD